VVSRGRDLTRLAAALAAALALAACTAGVPRTGEVVTVSPIQPPATDTAALEEGGGPAAGLSDTLVAQGFMSAMNTAKPERIQRWVMPKAIDQVRAWSARTTVNVYHSFQPDPLVVEDDKRIVPVRLDMVGRLERGREWTPRSDEDIFRMELQKAGAEWRVANPGKELWVRDVDFKKLYTPVEMFLVPPNGAAGRRLAPVPVFVRRAPPGTPAPEVLEARARAAVRCLLEGPEGRYVHLTSAIPLNTKLRSLVYDGGVVTVDLSSRFTDTNSGGSGELRVGQLVWTITRLIQTAQVRVLVEGKQVGTVGLDSFQAAGRLQRNEQPIAGLWPQRSSAADADKVLFARGGEIYTIPPQPNQKPDVIGFNAPSPKSAPTWSPDHHWIAFLSASGQDQQVWMLQPGAQAFPTTLTGRLSPPSWSADSSRLYVLTRNQGGTQLVEVTRRTLGVDERDLPTLPGGMRPTSLAVSPDGAWVLAVADHGDPQPSDRGGQLFLGRFSPRGVLGWYNRPIAPGLGRVFSPVWVDALTVAFIAETDNKDDVARLWMMKRDGWDPTPILNADPEGAGVPDIGHQLTVDPSGSGFIFTVRTPTGSSLWMVDRQGISPRPLTLPTAKEFDTDPSFASR
jgi:sporulation and spore germination protein/lipoprotein LpqB-like beta-propeller protein